MAQAAEAGHIRHWELEKQELGIGNSEFWLPTAEKARHQAGIACVKV